MTDTPAQALPLCPHPLLHDYADGVYTHKPDGSFCALLNDPRDAHDDAGDREANERENHAIERGAELWRREP